MSHSEALNFINNSGINVQRTNAPIFPRQLQTSMINNSNMGNFSSFVRNNNTSPSRQLAISGLKTGMFNATVNADFDSNKNLIDLKKILKSKPLGKVSVGNGLFIETKDIIGYYGRFKQGFSHTREYGEKGNINVNFFTAQIKYVLSNESESSGGTVNFYKNGKIRFSGGFVGKGENIELQPEIIRRFIVKHYTNGQQFLYNRFQYNNMSATFKINGVIRDMPGLCMRSTRYGIECKYDPELTPMLYATYKNHKYIISKSGSIQISGSSDPYELSAAYKTGKNLFELLHSKQEITLTSNTPNRVVKRGTRDKQKASTCPKERRPPCKPGFQAKKNPQGSDCCYKIPKGKTTRKSPVKTNELSYDNNGELVIGKKKCETLTKSTLLDVARKLGVVGIRDRNKKDRLCAMIKQFNIKNANMPINGRPCGTYKKQELIAIAMQKGIAVDNTDTVKTLCMKLKLDKNAKNQAEANERQLSQEINRAIRNDNAEERVKQRRRLDNQSIKNDIIKLYGKRWMKKYASVMNINKDVEEVKNIIKDASKINNLTNTKGVIKKMPANDIKKNIVSEWKKERFLVYKKKIIQKKYGKYGNAVVNYILMSSPTSAQIKKYIKTRENLAKNK